MDNFQLQKAPHRFSYATDQPQQPDLLDTLLNFVPFGTIGKKLATGQGSQITPGEVGMEAALTFLPFGKIAKGVAGIAKGGAKTATKAVAKGTAPMLLDASNSLERMSTIAPKSTLKTSAEQEALVKLSQRTPELRGSAHSKFTNVQSAINRMTDEVDDTLAGVKTTMPGASFARLRDEIGSSIGDANEQKQFSSVWNKAYKKVFGSDDLPDAIAPTQINAMRREVNKQASSAYRKLAAGNPLTAKETAIVTLREQLGDMIETLTPPKLTGKVQSLNQDMSTLIKAIPEFKKGSEQGFPLPFTGGAQLPGSKLPFQAVQAGASAAGRGVAALGGSSLPAQITRNAAGQVGRRATADMFGLRGQPEQPQGGLEDVLMQLPSTPGMGVPTEPADQGMSQGIPMENLQAALAAAPDAKSAMEVLSLYQALNDAMVPKQPKVTSAVAGTLTDMQKGLQTLQDLTDMVGGQDYAGGVVQGTLRGFNPFDNQFKQQQAMVDASRQIVGKALEGGVLRKEDEEKYRRILPTMQDNPEVALSKLQYIQGALSQALQSYSSLVGGGTAPSSLEESLMAQSAGY